MGLIYIPEERLRRHCDENLFKELKVCQGKINRFECSRKFEISLVTIRFCWQTSSYEEFKKRCDSGVMGITGKDSHSCGIEAEVQACDPLYSRTKFTYNINAKGIPKRVGTKREDEIDVQENDVEAVTPLETQ